MFSTLAIEGAIYEVLFVRASSLESVRGKGAISVRGSRGGVFAGPGIVDFIGAMSFILIFVVVLRSLSTKMFSGSETAACGGEFGGTCDFLLRPRGSLSVIKVNDDGLCDTFIPAAL